MKNVLIWCMIEKLKHSFNDKLSSRRAGIKIYWRIITKESDKF